MPYNLIQIDSKPLGINAHSAMKDREFEKVNSFYELFGKYLNDEK